MYAPATTQNAYVIDANDKIIVNRVLESTPSSDSQVTTQYKDSLSNPTKDAIISKILSEKGYIVSNNGVKAKNMEVFLKGIYINQQDIYFRIELTNTSNIPYTYNYIGFNMTSRKKGRVSSVEREDLEPTASYIPSKLIKYNETMTVIYKLKKFTPGSDRILTIEIIENEGERNFAFPVAEKTILNARAI